MDAHSYVKQAQRFAETLESRESAMASVDAPTARARISRRFGISKSVLHSLRYRPPKTIPIDVFSKLVAAVEHQAAELIRACEHDMATAKSCSIGVNDGILRALETSLANAKFHATALKTGAYPNIAYPDDILNRWPGKDNLK